MPNQDDVYTISDDAILDSMRRELERRGAMRPDQSAGGAEDRSRGSASRGKVRYAQPPASGTRAMWSSTFSLFLCGAGQAYNGQGKFGLLLLLTEALFVSVNWAVISLWSEVKEMVELFGITEWQLFVSLAASNYLMILISLGSVHQSYRHAEEIDGRFGGMDNPAISGIASMVVPGWGQLVNGQPGKAVVFLLGYLSGLYALALLLFTPLLKLLATVDPGNILSPQVNAVSAGVLVVAGIAWLLSVYDAMLVAGFRRRIS